MTDKIKEAPKSMSEEGRNREMSDKELDKVTGGDHGGGGRRISSFNMADWDYDPTTGRFTRRT